MSPRCGPTLQLPVQNARRHAMLQSVLMIACRPSLATKPAWRQAHADLLASSEFGPAAKVLSVELYSTEDLTQRDADIERVIRIRVKFPSGQSADHALRRPSKWMRSPGCLDARLGKALRAQSSVTTQPLRSPQRITKSPYRAMGDYLRLRQIALTEGDWSGTGQTGADAAVCGLLRMMRGPAHAGGVGGLHEFLERGYAALRT